MSFEPFATLVAAAVSLLLTGTPSWAREAGAASATSPGSAVSAHSRLPAPAEDPAAFTIVLDVSETRIAATCNAGCSWTEVSAAFEAGVYHITRDGISAYPVERRNADDPGFWITVSASGTGLSAICERGCGWKTVSGGRVTTRITEQGIEPAYPAEQADAAGGGAPGRVALHHRR